MEVIKTDIEGVVIIEPRLFRDGRGYFFESYSEKDFNAQVREVRFVQDNESKSSYGVLRGLHFQKPPYAQSKLVRVIKGAVLDVAVDIRKGSPTFGKHVAVKLTEDNHRQFFIPRGFAHGFSVLTPEVIFQYKCDTRGHLPVQVRQLLRAAERGRAGMGRPRPGHRLAHPGRQGHPVGKGQAPSPAERRGMAV